MSYQQRTELLRRAKALDTVLRESLERISRAFGVPTPPLIVTSRGVPNAQTDGRIVAVNPWWMLAAVDRHCRDERCARSLIMGVLVHELSHMLHDDHLTRGAWIDRFEELVVDSVAGWALQRFGLDHDDMIALLSEIGSLCGSATHPGYPDRGHVIARAYRMAEAGFPLDLTLRVLRAESWRRARPC